MNMPEPQDKPMETIWKPLTGLPPGAELWVSPDSDYDERVEAWLRLSKQIADEARDRRVQDIWLTEGRRSFAIETGEIEGLYTLKPGVAVRLMTEGLDGAVSSDTWEGIEDDTIRGLLCDQEAALARVAEDIQDAKPLTHSTVKNWHSLITRHQKTITAIARIGGQLQRVQVPFERKGDYKIRENNPRREDGVVFEYCPPAHVQSEMDRLFALYSDIRKQDLPTHVEAAWLHHRFVRTHPFQDGNGRVARLLMAYVYLGRGEPLPVISASYKFMYIWALENADRGDLKSFSDLLQSYTSIGLYSASMMAEGVLDNKPLRYRHPNGGITDKNGYHPPEELYAVWL